MNNLIPCTSTNAIRQPLFAHAMLPAQSKGSQTVALSFVLLLFGTGSTYNIQDASAWADHVNSRAPVHIETKGNANAPYEAQRTVPEHLARIHEVLAPQVSVLASLFHVSRQSIYKWQKGTAVPEPERLQLLRSISRIADRFQIEGLTNGSEMIRMPLFEGQNILQVMSTPGAHTSAVEFLFSKAKELNALYSASAASKAPASTDWLSDTSIPFGEGND